MGTPATPVVRKPVPVEVKVVDGKITCVPNEVEARPGDTIEWTGVAHRGKIDGRIPGEIRRGLTPEQLRASGKPEPIVPFSNSGKWATPGSPALKVNGDAPLGAYKYTVTVNGLPPLDPVVIIDNPPDGDGGAN